MGRVVGIDLGTTNSVVAVTEGGKPVVVANAEGMRTTPSVVGFNKDGELLVGQLARRQAVLNPQNTFYAVKRFIGRRYDELNPDSKRVPYNIRRSDEGSIRIRCPRLKREFVPEEISAKVIRKLADEASRYLGEEITGAVITVPAYFNDSQRQATRDAGRIAGLEVLRILNEPTAAALAYGLDRQRSQTIMVFDLGGGTFDVSILDVGDGVFEVRSTSGDTQLGGNDFDRKIVDWLAEQFLATEGIDLRKDRQSLQRLTEAAEKAKIELSGVGVTEINLPFITATEDGPKHIETKLSRPEFENLCGDLVNRLRRPLKRAINDAGISPVQIDEVVLVGGSTRIPLVQQLVRSFIDKEPNQNVNPDEVVAVGAAIQGAILQGEVKDILLLDVTPLSFGLETIGGVMKKLIPRNTTIPVRRSDIFSTSENNQTLVEVHVLQGEREMAEDNKSLGRFKLTGIPPAPRGIPQVQVAFDIDANGILQVTAQDRTTGRQQTVTIQGASTLSEAEVKRMMEEAEQFSDVDRERRERVEKRNRSSALIDQVQRRLREVSLDFGNQFANYHRRRLDGLVEDLRAAMERDDERGIDRSQADIQDAIYELNREVKNLYAEDEEDDFFGSLKRTFIGDDERSERGYNPGYGGYDNYGRDPRRDRYGRNPYEQQPRERNYDPYNRDNRGSGDYDRPVRASGRDRNPNPSYSGDYDRGGGYERSPRQPSAYNEDRYGSERNRNRNYERNRPNRPPGGGYYENDWDEDDDDWF